MYRIGKGMKAKVAVATVSGKAYYLIVNELKKRNIPFMSLLPQDPIPTEVKVVITTKEEQHQISHDKILTYENGAEPEALITEAMRIIQGKESYEKIVIGVDPGEVFGLAVLADGKVIDTENCFSIEETLNKIKNVIKSFEKVNVNSLHIKIGDGVPKHKESLLHILDDALPKSIILESVSEVGTNRHLNNAQHRRGVRDIVSAIKIAGRNGQEYARRKSDESNG